MRKTSDKIINKAIKGFKGIDEITLLKQDIGNLKYLYNKEKKYNEELLIKSNKQDNIIEELEKELFYIRTNKGKVIKFFHYIKELFFYTVDDELSDKGECIRDIMKSGISHRKAKKLFSKIEKGDVSYLEYWGS